MYKKLLIVLLQITHIFSEGLTTISDSAFCKICNCDNSLSDVNCEKEIVHHDIFNNTEYWYSSQANKSYPFRKISIHHSGIAVVTEIPESPVKVLDLSNNRIQVIEEGSFRNLQDMVELILSNNQLDTLSLHSQTLQGRYAAGNYDPLLSLRVLKLDGNEIHSIHQDFFQHTTKLETLDLHGNPLKYIDQRTHIALAELHYLKVLDLSYSQLEILPENIFHTMRNLEVLNLTGNDLTSFPTQIRDASTLIYLNLDGNHFVNITEKSGFPKMPKLKTLHMSYMPKLMQIEAHSMCGLTALEELYVTDNPKFSHIHAQALSERDEHVESATWPPIKKLILKNNKLAYLDRSLLVHWDKLEELDIRDNPWACECETQWMVDELIEIIAKIDKNKTIGVECSCPIEMNEISLYHLHVTNASLRCLDLYGNRPERDAPIIIGVLAGLLIFIPLVLGAIICYKKKWFRDVIFCGCRDTGPASYSRKFYSRTTSEDGDF